MRKNPKHLKQILFEICQQAKDANLRNDGLRYSAFFATEQDDPGDIEDTVTGDDHGDVVIRSRENFCNNTK